MVVTKTIGLFVRPAFPLVHYHVKDFHPDFIPILGGAVTYHNSNTGGIESTFDAVGVVDWGRVYASVFFPVSGNRSVLIGWTYVSNLPKFVITNSPHFGHLGGRRELGPRCPTWLSRRFYPLPRSLPQSYSQRRSEHCWS